MRGFLNRNVFKSSRLALGSNEESSYIIWVFHSGTKSGTFCSCIGYKWRQKQNMLWSWVVTYMVICKLTYSISWSTVNVYMKGQIKIVDRVFPQFQAIKKKNVADNINKILQVCVGKFDGLKISDVEVTLIQSVSVDDKVINMSLDIMTAITCGGFNSRLEIHIISTSNISNIACMKEEHYRWCVVSQKWFIYLSYLPFWWGYGVGGVSISYKVFKYTIQHSSILIFQQSEMLYLFNFFKIMKLWKSQ